MTDESIHETSAPPPERERKPVVDTPVTPQSSALPKEPVTSADIPTQVNYAQPNRRASAARQAFSRYVRLVALIDCMCVTAAALGGSALRFPGQNPSPIILLHVPVIIAIWMGTSAARGAYTREGLHSLAKQQGVAVTAALMSVPFVSMFSYAFKNQLSRGYLLFTLLLGIVLILVMRSTLWRRYRSTKAFAAAAQRALVIGEHDSDGGYEGLEFTQVAFESAPSAGAFEAWLAHVVSTVERERADVVLLTADHALSQERLRRLSWALEGRVDLVKQVDIGELGRRAFLRTEGGHAYLHLVEVGLTGPKRVLKRAFDLAVASFALIVLSPLLVIVALAIKLTSAGPVFFVQPRVGRYGRLFPFPKFRSMQVGAHDERAATLGTPDEDMLTRYRNDPRITPIGRVIRRFSIDELPQVWSVLRGQMSIVGPRPVLEEELQLLDSSDHRRHIAKPGLTGLWQVSGRKEVPWDQRMAMDIDYLENWSLLGDIGLVIRTLGTVFSGRGAM